MKKDDFNCSQHKSDFVSEHDKRDYFNNLAIGCFLVLAGIMLCFLGTVMFYVW